MTFLLAYCSKCKKKVRAFAILGEMELSFALANDADVQVMHASVNGDHRWSINYPEKRSLRRSKLSGRPVVKAAD